MKRLFLIVIVLLYAENLWATWANEWVQFKDTTDTGTGTTAYPMTITIWVDKETSSPTRLMVFGDEQTSPVYLYDMLLHSTAGTTYSTHSDLLTSLALYVLHSAELTSRTAGWHSTFTAGDGTTSDSIYHARKILFTGTGVTASTDTAGLILTFTGAGAGGADNDWNLASNDLVTTENANGSIRADVDAELDLGEPDYKFVNLWMMGTGYMHDLYASGAITLEETIAAEGNIVTSTTVQGEHVVSTDDAGIGDQLDIGGNLIVEGNSILDGIVATSGPVYIDPSSSGTYSLWIDGPTSISGELDVTYLQIAGASVGDNDGTVNEAGDPISWFKLKDIPAGFADGTDDGAAGVSHWTEDPDEVIGPATNTATVIFGDYAATVTAAGYIVGSSITVTNTPPSSFIDPDGPLLFVYDHNDTDGVLFQVGDQADNTEFVVQGNGSVIIDNTCVANVIEAAVYARAPYYRAAVTNADLRLDIENDAYSVVIRDTANDDMCSFTATGHAFFNLPYGLDPNQMTVPNATADLVMTTGTCYIDTDYTTETTANIALKVYIPEVAMWAVFTPTDWETE